MKQSCSTGDMPDGASMTVQDTEAAPLVQDWVQAAQARAVAEQTSALLQAHAATLAASLSNE